MSPPLLAIEVTEGSSVTLSCRYAVKRRELSRVCWGRGCGTLWCTDILAQTDGDAVVSKVSDRYRVAGDVQSGQVDLVIPKVNRMDSGPYCCRVDIDGYFNDKKVIHTLKVVKVLGPLLSLVSKVPLRNNRLWCEPHPYSKAPWVSDVVLHNETLHRALRSVKAEVSLHISVVLSRLRLPLPPPPPPTKSRPPRLPAAPEEEPIPSLSLQVNVPVLSLSLSLLLVLLLGSLALLGFKRSLSMMEPRHIIHEIRTRRPVVENIYTLD
ncbi:hypothetical protein JZ751_007170 [Albula glossodonta]|uniref:Ig-like domain-containing protein n=1 Tax=Albula glossodonta TaxID=121402 RepID=A0A8T2P2W9_9TELE|nr:hypothetical protein JZ751_007170 [Albula glossodonta]